MAVKLYVNEYKNNRCGDQCLRKTGCPQTESESFTRVIDRLITGRRPATLSALLDDLQKSGPPALTEAEAATINRVTAANRTEQVGPPVDLS